MEATDVPKTHPEVEDERQTKKSLIFGILLWFIHLNVVYGLASLACKWGWFSFRVGSISGLQVVEAILTLIALLLMCYLIFIPWKHWRSYQSENPPQNPHTLSDTEKDRRPLLAFITALMNSLFFLFIIASFVPIFALRACAQV